MKRIAIALTAGMLLASAGQAQAAGTLNPGDYSEHGDSACTLGFLFTGPGGTTQFSTAAHCVSAVGQVVKDIDGDQIGTVSYIHDPAGPAIGEDETATDFAFIQVLPSRTVSPAVAGHAGYPTGQTTSSQTRTGDRIQFSGWGLGFFATAPTREQRSGALTGDDHELWYGPGLDLWGDSGGPVVHIPTGRALGLVSRLCIGGCTSEGPTIAGIVAKAQAAGFPVSLRSVP